MSEKYEVEFEYFSNYENEEDNYSNNVTETFLVDSFDELCGMLGITDDEELFDMDYDDSEGTLWRQLFCFLTQRNRPYLSLFHCNKWLLLFVLSTLYVSFDLLRSS